MSDIIILLISANCLNRPEVQLNSEAPLQNGRSRRYGWMRLHSQFLIVAFGGNPGARVAPETVRGILRAAMRDTVGEEIRERVNEGGGRLCLWIHAGDLLNAEAMNPEACMTEFATVEGTQIFSKVLVESRVQVGNINLAQQLDALLDGKGADAAVGEILQVFDQPREHNASISEMTYSIRHELFRLIGTVELDLSIGSAAAFTRIGKALQSFATESAEPSVLEKRISVYQVECRETGGDSIGGLSRLIGEGRKIAGKACSQLRDALKAGADEKRVAEHARNSCAQFVAWIDEFRKACQDAEAAVSRKVSS